MSSRHKKHVKPKDIAAVLDALSSLTGDFWAAIEAKDMDRARSRRADLENFLGSVDRRIRDMSVVRTSHEDVLASTAIDLEGIQHYDMTPEVWEVLGEMSWLRHQIEESGAPASERLREELELFLDTVDKHMLRHPAVTAAIEHTRNVRDVRGL